MMTSPSSESTQVEHIVTAPIINPDTGHPMRAFRYAGKVDRVETAKLIDWKSTSNIKAFIQRMTIGFQADCYAIALEAAGTPITDIEFRLIQRPSIKFCGKDKDTTGKMDRKMYEDRCVEWLRDKEQGAFEFEQPINPARREQAMYWLHDTAKLIMYCRQTGRWLTNDGACHDWNRECPYLLLCEALSQGTDVDEIIRQDFQSASVHQELEQDALSSPDILTYSSAGIMNTCSQKYFWRHEKGIVRKIEDVDARWTGSAMHAGMEALGEMGLEAALDAIDTWAAKNPVLGADGYQDQAQSIARARAMVRVGVEKWCL